MDEGRLKFEYGEMEIEQEVDTKIKVIGVGGCGCNIVNDMYEIGVNDCELLGVNTDKQSLDRIQVEEKIQIGKQSTKGRGSGNNPELAEHAAEEDRDFLENRLSGTDMLFITCGLGGGTGSGAAPVIAEISRNMDILTVAVVITPFEMEMDDRKRNIVAKSMARLKEKVNNIIVISNDKIMEVCDRNLPVQDAYREVNKVMINIINGLVTMIAKTGIQNIDFEDVKANLKQPGEAFIGIGRASGTDKAKKAFESAVKNPFIGDIDLNGARSILVNFIGNITLNELKEIEGIKKITGKNACVKFGIVNDNTMGDEIEVVILISGIYAENVMESVNEEEKQKQVSSVEMLIRQTAEGDYDNTIIDQPAYQRLAYVYKEKETRN